MFAYLIYLWGDPLREAHGKYRSACSWSFAGRYSENYGWECRLNLCVFRSGDKSRQAQFPVARLQAGLQWHLGWKIGKDGKHHRCVLRAWKRLRLYPRSFLSSSFLSFLILLIIPSFSFLCYPSSLLGTFSLLPRTDTLAQVHKELQSRRNIAMNMQFG